jgi:hypothetical protein
MKTRPKTQSEFHISLINWKKIVKEIIKTNRTKNRIAPLRTVNIIIQKEKLLAIASPFDVSLLL